MKVLLFGVTRDIIGESEITLSEQLDTVADLRDFLGEKHPKLLQLSSLAVAVNNNYANDEDKINSFDEIALIPPVSGG